MGMSASQARYLQLTARKSDLEFQAQQICQARLSLAQQTEAIGKTYSSKMNDRHLYFASANDAFGQKTSSLQRLTYSDITRSQLDENPGMGMRVVNQDGKIIAPGIPAGANPDDYVIDLNCLSADYLENKLRDAQWGLQKKAPEGTVDGIDWVDVSFYTDNHISDMLYMENDSAAEAEYTRASETLQKHDKALEMQLTQITTQQKSLDTEMDSVKKVLEKNIEGSFKTFA